jgi:hypothetical protein
MATREDRHRATAPPVTLLAVAGKRSPSCRRRLRSVDPESFSEADLPRRPPLSKTEVMEHIDEIVTDSRLSYQAVDVHVAKLRRDCCLPGRLRALATGGPSGQRRVFVYDWTTFAAMVDRRPMSDARLEGSTDPGTVVCVLAGRATHISGTGTARRGRRTGRQPQAQPGCHRSLACRALRTNLADPGQVVAGLFLE